MTNVKKIDGLDALVYFDNVHNEYTIISAERGGAIVNDKDKVVAIEKWKKGMQIAESINKFLSFKKVGTWSNS